MFAMLPQKRLFNDVCDPQGRQGNLQEQGDIFVSGQHLDYLGDHGCASATCSPSEASWGELARNATEGETSMKTTTKTAAPIPPSGVLPPNRFAGGRGM